jgi:uncharacterized protein (DUF983 family)
VVTNNEYILCPNCGYPRWIDYSVAVSRHCPKCKTPYHRFRVGLPLAVYTDVACPTCGTIQAIAQNSSVTCRTCSTYYFLSDGKPTIGRRPPTPVYRSRKPRPGGDPSNVIILAFFSLIIAAVLAVEIAVDPPNWVKSYSNWAKSYFTSTARR